MLPLIVFLALFLLLLTALALAAIKLFAVKDPAGSVTAPGCLAGCATAAVLGFIALLGLAAFIAGIAAISALDAVKHNPIERVGVWVDPQRDIHHDPERPLHIVVEWSGHSEPNEELIEFVHEAVEGDDITIQLDYTTNDHGEDITVADVSLRADEHDIADLEEALRDVFDEASVSRGIEIRLRSARRD